jgi:hypothetical protein
LARIYLFLGFFSTSEHRLYGDSDIFKYTGETAPVYSMEDVVQPCSANHHIIISQRHVDPVYGPEIVGENTAQSLRTIIIHRIIITINKSHMFGHGLE